MKSSVYSILKFVKLFYKVCNLYSYRSAFYKWLGEAPSVPATSAVPADVSATTAGAASSNNSQPSPATTAGNLLFALNIHTVGHSGLVLMFLTAM